MNFGVIFDQLFSIAALPHCFASYFIALVYKVDSPTSLGDFRPMLLVCFLYKLISKVLDSKLEPIMDYLISLTQYTFLNERQLVDWFMVVNKVSNLGSNYKKECLILKLDFVKTRDLVSQSFFQITCFKGQGLVANDCLGCEPVYFRRTSQL